MRRFVGSGIAAFALAALLVTVSAQDRKADAERPKGKGDSAHGQQLSGDMVKDMRMMNEMMVKHLGQKDAGYEKRFIDMMIPHHEGAILMAKHAVKNANRPELKAMAEEVIKAQEKEIEQLKKWRKEWYEQKDNK